MFNIFKKEKKIVTAIDKLNELISREIVPKFEQYNDASFDPKEKNSSLFLSAGSKEFLHRSPKIATTKNTSGMPFVLNQCSDTIITSRSSKSGTETEIVARQLIPYSLLTSDITDAQLTANLFVLYKDMFNKIKELSELNPNEPFLGRCYFRISLNENSYVFQPENSQGLEIRAYHHHYNTDNFRVEN